MQTNEESNIKAEDNDIKSSLVSRNVTIQGRRTSIRLEPEMWMSLGEIAKREQCTIHDVCTLVSMRKKEETSLTAAIRVFIMLYFRAASTEEGHSRVGHGNFNHMQQRAGLQKTNNEARAFWNTSNGNTSGANASRVKPAYVQTKGVDEMQNRENA